MKGINPHKVFRSVPSLSSETFRKLVVAYYNDPPHHLFLSSGWLRITTEQSSEELEEKI